MIEIKQFYHRLPYVLGPFVSEQITNLSRLNKITVEGTEEKRVVQSRLKYYMDLKKSIKTYAPTVPEQK